jgi:GDPmannose 4,6-dehydratase
MTDATNLIRIIQDVQPDEIYNLAAQSHVAVSFESPEYTPMPMDWNAKTSGSDRILKLRDKTAFYQQIPIRTFRQGSGNPSKGNHPTVLSPFTLCRRQTVRYWIT